MYQRFLGDARFFRLLLDLDTDLAIEAGEGDCPCGGKLHSARYRRKPRGGPEGLGAEHSVRFSFCCAREGCRRRVTPVSLRFLGRKVFFSVVVLLLPVLREGPTPQRVARLGKLFGVSLRTLHRWRRWWREVFAEGRFWREASGRFAEPVEMGKLPGSLLEVFREQVGESEHVVALLRFLAPITGGLTSRVL